MKKSYAAFSLLLVAAFVMAACTPAAGGGFKACQVTDTGGIDDKSFNATAWKGIEDAVDQLEIEGKFLESQQQTDYEANINAFLEEGCDVIVTVGFLLGDATKAGAEANPDTKFSIVDFAYDPTIPNVLGQVFNTDEAAFLAGYAAAASTQTGKVGTFGGIQIGPVTDFMDGFVAGVNYYNDAHGTTVEVLGWDPATQTGAFTGDFDDQDKGKQKAEELMQEDADIIFPVAGPVGIGAMAAVNDNLAGLDPAPMFIGVDVDQFISVPGNENIMLSSVLKRIDNAVFAAVEGAMALDGGSVWESNLYVGLLANDGVGMAPFHNFEDAVPAALVTEIDGLKAALIAGDVTVADWSGQPAASPAS